MPQIKVGQTFEKTRQAFAEEGWVTAEVRVMVLQLVKNYYDAWTGVTHEEGVRFEITDSVSGVSYHTLSLDTFRTSWT